MYRPARASYRGAMGPSQEEALQALGYASRWLEYGLLTAEQLQLQYAHLQSGEDTHTEHYRYASFMRILAEGPLPDARLTHYVELVEVDPDATMARAALHELLTHPTLTDAQVAAISRHRWFEANVGLLRRVQMLRALDRGELTPSLLEQCLVERDAAVQEALLKLESLPPETLARLAEVGASRRVRNIAGSRLRRR